MLPFSLLAADQRLFIIERTTNGNIVHYDARLDATGHIDPREPVVVYWTIGSATGKRQNLNYLERTRAYGIHVRAKANGRYLLTVVSQKEVEIDVYEDNGKVRAETTIDGHRAYLNRIFANIESTLFLPRVRYVELFGTDVSSGVERYQKILSKSYSIGITHNWAWLVDRGKRTPQCQIPTVLAVRQTILPAKPLDITAHRGIVHIADVRQKMMFNLILQT